MSNVQNGNTVKVHYTGRLKNGTVFDTSIEREPLKFRVGSGEVISGFDNAVLNMSVGEKKTVEIPPEEAYGPRMNELVLDVPKEKFGSDVDPKQGDQYNLTRQDGGVVTVTVTDVKGETVTLDANHSLAGETLIFEMELIEIE
ncbi:MAG: peptidylprolyl isomerase [Melioribacteraceae bacterium]|nr:peptidylprolyl isomerase [Melioribacteraceae bacterium]